MGGIFLRFLSVHRKPSEQRRVGGILAFNVRGAYDKTARTI